MVKDFNELWFVERLHLLKLPAAQTIQDLLKATREVRLSGFLLHWYQFTTSLKSTSTTKMGKYMCTN